MNPTYRVEYRPNRQSSWRHDSENLNWSEALDRLAILELIHGRLNVQLVAESR